MDRRWVADVLVVGAGASGLITARRMLDAGYSVMLLERGAVGGEQSNHSHGYMHRGHIYLTPTPDLVRNLSQGADRWRAEMDALDLPSISDRSSLAFTNPHDADVAASAWRRAGLTFLEETGHPDGVRPGAVTRSYLTDEATYDFTAWLAAMHGMLDDDPRIRILNADVLRLERDAGLVVGAVVSIDGRDVLLASSYVVLCGGTGNLALAASVINFRGNALNRTSPMMVLRGPRLPKLVTMFHGHETHGLFIASRPSDEGWVWLVSNYVSFAGAEASADAIGLWVRDIRSTLLERTTGLDDPENVWGYYQAEKGELRNVRSALNAQNVQTYGFDNLIVASPTKLTLTPLLGDLVMEVLREQHGQPRRAGWPDLEQVGSGLSVSAERWRAAPLEPIDTMGRS